MLKMLHWPFRSFSNFAISAIGITAISFWGYSIYSENNFNQPIVGESIKILGKNPQIKELVGYPLAYSFSVSNRYVQKQDETYFSFKVTGPKSTTNVEMTTGKAEAGKLYDYGLVNPKISQIQSRIKTQEDKIKDLDQEYASSTTKKPRQKEIALQKSVQANKLKQIKVELIEAKYQIIQKRNRYFVPDKQLYTKINDPRSKGSNQIVPKEEVMTGIHDLVITLPNRTKMIVYPEAKKKLQEKKRIVESYNSPDPPTIGQLNKKIVLDISDLSKEQIEEYGKQKTNFMYSKYGSYRIMSMVLFISGIWGLIMYRQRNVLKTVKGSILQHEVKTKVGRNNLVNQVLRNKNKSTVEFDELVGGGIVNNNFKCVMYIKNLTNGRVECQGKYHQDMNIYEYTKLLLRYNDKEVKKEIDLLSK